MWCLYVYEHNNNNNNNNNTTTTTTTNNNNNNSIFGVCPLLCYSKYDIICCACVADCTWQLPPSRINPRDPTQPGSAWTACLTGRAVLVCDVLCLRLQSAAPQLMMRPPPAYSSLYKRNGPGHSSSITLRAKGFICLSGGCLDPRQPALTH